MRQLLAFLAAALLLFGSSDAQASEPSPAFRARASELVAVLKGEAEPERIFAPSFLAAVPSAQVKSIAGQLSASHGAPTSVAAIEAKTATTGTVTIAFERATVRMDMAIAAAPPNLIEQLLVTGVQAKGDSVRDVFGAITALPGEVSLSAARLGNGEPQYFLTQKADRPMAIGSSFKLFILAELVRQIKAGERHWSDVVAIDRASLPSGFLQQWPKGSPITLHSLSALMISQSDNTATDVLLGVLGREKVERGLPQLGVQAPERLRPFLFTREAFLLKAAPPALRERWAAAGEAERRALLADEIARGRLDSIDPAAFSGAPAAIATVEWFAATRDLVHTLDWLRRNGDPATLDILAINPGLPDLRAAYDYVGFKGGSEGGVLNLSFLLRRKDGVWLAVSASWNNEAAELDQARFMAALSRLLVLAAKDSP